MACSSSDVALNVATTKLRATGCKTSEHSYSLRAESYNSMIKSFIAAAAATVALAGSAVAGPIYINAERNDGFTGSTHGGAINEVHVGVEGALTPTISGYAQAGPAYIQPSTGSGEIEFSGKAGASVALGESTSAYGEVSFVTGDDDNGYGIKTGIKHNF